jgi:predicted phosphodiesterase
MKICVLSDIHGNGSAFNEAYPLILKEMADVNIFLGDLCGYSFDEKEVWEKLQKIPHLISLKGNHDDLFLRGVAGDSDCRQRYVERYGKALECFLEKDISEMVSWMKRLSPSYEDHDLGLLCYHGSPRDPLEEYVYPDTSLESFAQEGFDICFLGHTHYPFVRI